MVEQLTLQTTISFLTLISLTIGVIYHIMTLRNTRKNQQLQLDTRQAQLFMALYDHYNSIDYKKQASSMYFNWDWSDIDEFMERYGPDGDANNYAIFSSVTSFYDGIGVLVKNGLVDVNLVSDIMSGSITRLWERYGPAIRGVRERYDWPQYREYFEFLYTEVKPIVEQQYPRPKT
jgi:hypothetical protein